MKFLLLQARTPEDPSAEHEVAAFCEIMQRPAEALEVWSLLDGAPPGSTLDQVDCVLVGGSGEFGVTDFSKAPWLSEFIQFMGELVERGFPTFASCFGFQALCVALGGRVEVDKSRGEVGTFELYVTEAGQGDPLFSPLHPRFFAQLGHKDHVTKLPEGVVHLAGSARSEFQALKIPGKPIYATQFHPELSMERNRQRFMTYIESYADPSMPDTPEEVLAAYRPTQGASDVLKRYVDEVLPAAL